MRRLLLATTLLLGGLCAMAQQTDGQAFRGYLVNHEFNVYMRINFYEKDVVITWQDVFGQLPGFMARYGDARCWIVAEATMDGNKAELEMINDYGVDDLTATLTQVNDTTYTFQHRSGSPMKYRENGKWRKLPSTMTFIKKSVHL